MDPHPKATPLINMQPPHLFNWPLYLAIPPRVTEEADRMMRKLRDLQAQVDERSSDVVRKESQMSMLEAEKDAAVKRLRDAEGTVLSS